MDQPSTSKPLPVITAEIANEALPEVDKQILDYFLSLDAKGKFPNAPKTPDELHLFIQVAFGVTIPRKAVIEGHSAPFTFISDLYFEQEAKNALAFASRSAGKCLWVETPVLTANRGWTTLGDIKVGDEVFTPTGKPTKVVWVGEPIVGKPCFKVDLDTDSFIADGEHIWPVHCTISQAEKDKGEQLRTTEQMREFLESNPNPSWYKTLFSMSACAPLEYPEKEYPVDPYLLGVWLGDGGSNSGIIFSWDAEMGEHIKECWEDTKEYKHSKDKGFRCHNLGYALRKAGLTTTKVSTTKAYRPREKRIPDEYLRGSIEQRWELLRGLLDTDGHAHKNRPTIEISLTNKALIDGVLELARGLGIICRYYERGPGRCKYKGETVYGSPVYRITFQLKGSDPSAFKLSRKAARNTVGSRRIVHKVKSIQPTESKPVVCIKVADEKSLFLVGKALVPTHNTFGVALLNMCEMLFKPECEIAHGGAVRTQAAVCYKYFLGFLNLPWFKELNMRYEALSGKPFIVKETQIEAVFANGASQTIIVASEKGLRSPHPQKARLDEIDLLEWDLLQTGLSMARSKRVGSKTIRGQNVFTSTRQNEHGSMQRLLECAEEKGIKVYEWNIWDVVQTCPRQCLDDPVHGTCPIYTFCQGRAHESEGFYPIDDFIDKARLLDREQFEVEWENKRPSRAKLVYPMFDVSRHGMTSDKLWKMTGKRKPHPTWQVVSGVDFGFSQGHPFVYLKFCQLPSGPWLCFWEYAAEGRLLRDHATAIKTSPFWKYQEPIYSDWDAQDRRELREMGVKLILANKDVELGINHIRTLLSGTPPDESPNLYFWVSDVDEFKPVTLAIREFGSYSYPQGSDGRPVSNKPIKVNDNSLDAARYALFGWKSKGPGASYRSYSVPGL